MIFPASATHAPRPPSPGPPGPLGGEASFQRVTSESAIDPTVETDRISITAAADVDTRLSSRERLTNASSSLTNTPLRDRCHPETSKRQALQDENQAFHDTSKVTPSSNSAHQPTPALLRRQSALLEKQLEEEEQRAVTSSNEGAPFRSNDVPPQPAPIRTPKHTEFIKQPKTRSITQEQLVAEVKGIYAGLVLIEQKCIEVDSRQAKKLEEARQSSDIELGRDQYKALIALHKTLLNEHHDFFLASQHPSANSALKRLATKYSMPARMWRHAIHSFLELLRHRLPHSKDHMLAFIYIAYSMMALLFETVKAFEDTWIECLGDLARYRMAIEDDDFRDREVWMEVASFWYTKAADRSPSTGRLYHHLAILARPNLQKQLFFYTKSLTVSAPFPSTRDSILTLLKPVMERDHTSLKVLKSDHLFIRFHARLFLRKDLDLASRDCEQFLSDLMNSIGRAVQGWKQIGAYQAASNAASLFGYGSDDSLLRQCIATNDPCVDWNNAQSSTAGTILKLSIRMTFGSLKTCLQLTGNYDVQPYIHITLVLVWYLQNFPSVVTLLENDVPWMELSEMLNILIRMDSSDSRMAMVQTSIFPQMRDSPRPLTEDFLLRQMLYAENYFPKDLTDPKNPKDWWFNKAVSDDDDSRTLELTSMQIDRSNRILALGICIAASRNPLEYSPESKSFFCHRSELDRAHNSSIHPSQQSLKVIIAPDTLASWPPQLDAYFSCRLCDLYVPLKTASVLLGPHQKHSKKLDDMVRESRVKVQDENGHIFNGQIGREPEAFYTRQEVADDVLAVSQCIQTESLDNKSNPFGEISLPSNLYILTEDDELATRALETGIATIQINGQMAEPTPRLAPEKQFDSAHSFSKNIRPAMSMEVDEIP